MMIKDPLIGQQLDEYKLIRLLGRGGMARVYEATDSRLGRQVAIKVIDAPYREEDSYRERFMREAKAIAQLEHPNIVRLYRYGEVDGLFYIAMQFVQGQDLLDRLARVTSQGQLLENHETLYIVDQVCQALDYVHSKGVIHRDIKPSNILLDDNDHVLLSDFGLAMTDATQTQGEIFGSPYYIAPEQAISSASAVPQSDLYALGTILYQMVTGKRPFEADNALSLAMMHTSEPPTPPRQIRPSISPAVERVILRAMAKEPRQRYTSGEALATALREAFEPQRSDTPSPPPVAELPKRPLPPTPAAVINQSALKTAPPPLTPPPPAKRRWGCLLWGVLFIALLITAGWLFNGQLQNIVDQQLARITLPPAVVRITAEPQDTPTATTPPTKTATAIPPTATTAPTSEPTREPTKEPAATVFPEPTNTAIPSQASPTTISSTETAIPPTETARPEPTTPLEIIVLTRETDNMPMVLIRGTTFTMGRDDSLPDQQPAHPITLNDYYLDRFEVSVGQYAQFLNEFVGFDQYGTGCFGALCLRTRFEGEDSFMTTNNQGHTGQGESEDRPVNHIRHLGAKAYCEWVGGRLPTEAEWELAARGPEGRIYAWGNELPDETRATFGYEAIGETYQLFIQPVDAFPAGATPLGIYGLTGGVAEWTADLYAADFYATSPRENPLNETGDGSRNYVVRGGAWNTPLEALPATTRDSLAIIEDTSAVGFRCAYTP